MKTPVVGVLVGQLSTAFRLPLRQLPAIPLPAPDTPAPERPSARRPGDPSDMFAEAENEEAQQVRYTLC